MVGAMREYERQTGRSSVTLRMAKNAVSAGEDVTIVGANQHALKYLKNLFKEIGGNPEIVRFTTADSAHKLKGLDTLFFIDHYVWECGWTPQTLQVNPNAIY